MDTLIVVLCTFPKRRSQGSSEEISPLRGIFTVLLILADLHLELKRSSFLSRISKVFREFGAKL